MTNKNGGSFVATTGGKKQNETSDLVGLNASMKTAVTMNNSTTNTKNGTLLNIGFGMTSPFKDAMSKGIVSGMGLLTF
jgi:hypothetical protein